MIKLVEYNEMFLDKSWVWLNDKEIKELTNTPDFTREDQKKWFSSLANKLNYRIWGVCYDGIPIGVFGIKNIDVKEAIGEYWGYIGEKLYWGKGLGTEILEIVLSKAKNDLGIKTIILQVLDSNEVAIKLYKKKGFVETHKGIGIIYMEKKL